MTHPHSYQLAIEWTGNSGEGTKTYRSYERSFSVRTEGKPVLLGSSDPAFRGDTTRWNPEELLLAALSSCHMLWYLHLCSEQKIIVTHYKDTATAIMAVDPSGKGKFTEATLHPEIVITDETLSEKAKALHPLAHQKCFIANSLNFPVNILPRVIRAS